MIPLLCEYCFSLPADIRWITSYTRVQVKNCNSSCSVSLDQTDGLVTSTLAHFETRDVMLFLPSLVVIDLIIYRQIEPEKSRNNSFRVVAVTHSLHHTKERLAAVMRRKGN